MPPSAQREAAGRLLLHDVLHGHLGARLPGLAAQVQACAPWHRPLGPGRLAGRQHTHVQTAAKQALIATLGPKPGTACHSRTA